MTKRDYYEVLGVDKGADEGEIARRDADRALPKVDVQHVFRHGLEDVRVAQQMRNRPVAMPRVPFGRVHCFVDGDRVAEVIPILSRPIFAEPGTFGFMTQPSLFGRGVGGGRTIELNA